MYVQVCQYVNKNDLSNILYDILVISWRSVLLIEEAGGPGENH
jgi:hypothetical protein